MPDFQVQNLEGNTLRYSDMSKGVTVIDFWATWCGSCLPGLQKLSDLKQELGNDLHVMALSYESEERIQRFKKQRPYNLLFVRDTAETLRDYFPHRMIPHSILIGPDGRVLAITNGDQIDRPVIERALRGAPIILPHKQDNTEFDYTADYFQADTNTVSAFDIQPGLAGVGAFSKQPTRGPFADRRISIHLNLPGLYRKAYQMSSERLQFRVPEERFEWDDPDNRYFVDLIVAPEDREQLFEIMQQKLAASFNVQARMEVDTMEVAVLLQPDSLECTLTTTGPVDGYEARGDYFSAAGASLATFADYLESFGITGMPVVDETGLPGHYAIDLQFDPEQSGSFHKALREMGLVLRKRRRPIDVLVLYEESK